MLILGFFCLRRVVSKLQAKIEQYMQRAIELAKNGIGKVNPNPLVGAVIVKQDRIIGEGYHARYGDLHAERNAFSNLKEDCTGADMYVTLEPCCHQGKQPPCTQAIMEHKIRKVYVGSMDPNILVAGKGIQQLRDAGIEVVTNVMQEECDALNPIFFHYITNKTPYVVMKYAMTMDGKIATYAGYSRWISNEQSRNHSQHTRNRLSGIMVGIGTVLLDNPMLTCRIENGNNPTRIICDSHLQIPLDCQLVNTAKEVPTYVATLEQTAQGSAVQDKVTALQQAGVRIITLPESEGHINLCVLMQKLGSMGIDSVLLEGGGTLNYSALQAGIVNRIQAYIAPKLFGGMGKYTPVSGQGILKPENAFICGKPSVQFLGDDILLEYDVIRNSEEKTDCK